MKPIRYLNTGTANAAKNMAIDEILFENLQKSREFSGFIRFYCWNPPAMSFGYSQKIERLIDVARARNMGYDLVKRPTGGRMVFHADELTFSVGFNLDKLRKNKNDSFLECFIRALTPFVNALNEAGIPAKFSDKEKARKRSSNQIHCFASAAGHSIFVNNKKLIGAAGMVKNNFIAVHGSLPVSVSFPDETCFKTSVSISEDVFMVCLNDFLQKQQIGKFPELVRKNFSDFFSAKVINYELSADECDKSEKLALNKFSDLDWKR